MIDSRSLTLFECFDHNLPNYQSTKERNDPRDSSGTIALTYPPKFLEDFSISGQDWWTRGRSMLNRMKDFDLLQHRMPATEPLQLVLEADVAKASTLYLIHPITIALQAFVQPGYVIETSLEQHAASNNTNIRMDITWNRRDLGNSDHKTNKKPFAILELKRAPMIFEKMFDSAYLNYAYDGDRAKALRHIARRAIRDQSLSGGAPRLTAPQAAKKAVAASTLIEDSGLPLIKQISGYAISNQVRRTALFDWFTLVLVNFNHLEEKSVGESAEMTVLMEREDTTTNKRKQGQTARKVLFSWVLQAYYEEFPDAPVAPADACGNGNGKGIAFDARDLGGSSNRRIPSKPSSQASHSSRSSESGRSSDAYSHGHSLPADMAALSIREDVHDVGKEKGKEAVRRGESSRADPRDSKSSSSRDPHHSRQTRSQTKADSSRAGSSRAAQDRARREREEREEEQRRKMKAKQAMEKKQKR